MSQQETRGTEQSATRERDPKLMEDSYNGLVSDMVWRWTAKWPLKSCV